MWKATPTVCAQLNERCPSEHTCVSRAPEVPLCVLPVTTPQNVKHKALVCLHIYVILSNTDAINQSINM